MNHERPPQIKKPPSGNLVSSEGKLSTEQKAALKFSVRAGKEIQLAIPNIAIDYTSGASLSQLAEKYDIQKRFGLTSKKVAAGAVLMALTGFEAQSGVTGMESYPGLITNREILRTIGEKHSKDWGKKQGARQRDEKLGIFSMTREEQQAVGKKSGKFIYEHKIGIHGRTAEERKEHAIQGVIAKGFKPFSDDEKTLIAKLATQIEYRKTSDKLNTEKMALEINRILHNGNQIRTGKQVSKLLSDTKYRNKKLEKPQI